jgi:hypothetical protein
MATKDRAQFISSKVTTEEREALRRIAFEQNKTLSSLIRDLLLDNPILKQRIVSAPSVEEIDTSLESNSRSRLAPQKPPSGR